MSEILLVENALDAELLSLNQRRELWRTHRERFLPAVAALKQLGADITFPNSLDARLSGDRHLFAAVVRALRTRGFTTTQPPPEKGQGYWSAFFELPEVSDLRIWLSFSSTVCRQVQVGTKMVEQPIFETVCDELTLPEERAA